ncbi:MAG TPA: SRPBCC family protein [Candidatus Limnocylindrales bacterium]|nr:SRPBCC family protein [Candidatus Limnocylindrales bacterium]
MVVRPRLVCIPSTDAEFAADATALLARLFDAAHDEAFVRAELERRLRASYPGAVVRPQEPLARMAESDELIWYATKRTYQFRIAASFDVSAPPDVAFGVYIDRFPEWQRAVSLRPIEPTRRLVGREFAATYMLFGMAFEGRFRVIDADPPRSVRVEAVGSGGIRVWYITSFEPSGNGTHLDVLGDYDVPPILFPRLQRLVLERVIGRDIDRAHADLRELCAREAIASTSGRTAIRSE